MTNKPKYRWSTKDIASKAKYFDTPSSFFSNFPSAWNTVKSTVWKLETRQVYIEAGNASYELLRDGKKNEAIDLVPVVREEDRELYEDLMKREVEFIRCRPVAFPLTQYLEWEIACYHYNASHGEKIFFTDLRQWEKKFQPYALHDFMVFDTDLAFIHNYDPQGEISGGWMTINKDHVATLKTLFADIRSVSIEYTAFLRTHSSE